MTTNGYLCLGGNVYCFQGWTFEVHDYCGPWPLNKDGSPRKTAPGRVFWKMWDAFEALSDEEREACLVERGGCVQI